jgi:predicted membrane channel-forming protein YqfA (hemolysin III family)
MKKKLITLSGLGLILAPVAVFAQQFATNCSNVVAGGIEAVICKISSILNLIIPVIIVLGVVYFVWGIVTYVIADDEEAKKAGTQRMIYGIIGLVVIVGMWGLVRIVMNTFGLNNNQQGIYTPCVAGTPGC